MQIKGAQKKNPKGVFIVLCLFPSLFLSLSLDLSSATVLRWSGSSAFFLAFLSAILSFFFFFSFSGAIKRRQRRVAAIMLQNRELNSTKSIVQKLIATFWAGTTATAPPIFSLVDPAPNAINSVWISGEAIDADLRVACILPFRASHLAHCRVSPRGLQDETARGEKTTAVGHQFRM